MSYTERGTWAYLAVAVLTYVGYAVTVLVRGQWTPGAETAYVVPMLWAIGISLVLNALLHGFVEAAHSRDPHRSDVRDEEIHRLGEYRGFFVLAFGFVPAFALTLLEADHFWIANAMYLAFVLNAVTSSVVKIVAYRRGI